MIAIPPIVAQRVLEACLTGDVIARSWGKSAHLGLHYGRNLDGFGHGDIESQNAVRRKVGRNRRWHVPNRAVIRQSKTRVPQPCGLKKERERFICHPTAHSSYKCIFPFMETGYPHPQRQPVVSIHCEISPSKKLYGCCLKHKTGTIRRVNVHGKSSLTISRKPVGLPAVCQARSQRRQFWLVAAEREVARRFIVHADEVLTRLWNSNCGFAFAASLLEGSSFKRVA